jgi:hypothetical protein
VVLRAHVVLAMRIKLQTATPVTNGSVCMTRDELASWKEENELHDLEYARWIEMRSVKKHKALPTLPAT